MSRFFLSYINVWCLLSMTVLVMLLSACAGKSGYAPVSSIDYTKEKRLTYRQKSAKYHTVKRGETLYSISWNYGKNFKELARINGIKSPYVIHPGQKIALKTSSKPKSSKAKKTIKNNEVKSVVKPIKKAPVIRRSNDKRTAGKVQWQWPASGKLIGTFSSNGRFNKGIDIAGKLGEPVYAAAKGKVVFAGSGLRGYGKLVIIHHNETYLSAYAHNSKLLVKENQIIKAGQKIAEIGSTGTDKPKLHFEVRKNGKPVNPLQYLPKR